MQHLLPLSPAVLFVRGYTLDGFVLGRKLREKNKRLIVLYTKDKPGCFHDNHGRLFNGLV